MIEILDAGAGEDASIVDRIAGLVNEVYAESEKGLWLGGAERTTTTEVAGLIRAGQIAVARLDDRIVGCVRVQRLDNGYGEFGMLAADPERRGQGIGRELVRFAERRSREDGLPVMQLELIVPRTWSHPDKDALDTWYTRIGYRVTSKGTIDESYPALAPLLATPCDFLVYHKDLA